MSTLFVMLALVFLVICFLCIAWIHKKSPPPKNDTEPPPSQKKDIDEGFVNTTQVTTTSFTGLGGVNGISAIISQSGSGSTTAYTMENNRGSRGSRGSGSGPTLPFFTSIANTFIKTPYDPYYDMYAEKEKAALSDMINNFKFLSPPAETVTSNKGQSLGVCDLTSKSVPWDSDNASAKQSDILWGAVSSEASKSLFLKVCIQEIASRAQEFNRCGDDPNAFCYSSPYLRINTSDPMTAGAYSVVDGIISSVPMAIQQIAMQRADIWKADLDERTRLNNQTRAVGDIQTNTTKAGPGMENAIGSKKSARLTAGLQAQVKADINIKASNIRSATAVGAGSAIGAAAAGLVTATAASVVTAGAAAPLVAFFAALTVFCTFFFGIFGMIMMILQGFIDPIVQNLFKVGGECPGGFTAMSSVIPESVSSWLYGMIPGLGLLGTFDPYVCYKAFTFNDMADIIKEMAGGGQQAGIAAGELIAAAASGIGLIIVLIARAVKMKIPPKLPSFFYDRSLSIIYHSSFLAGLTDVKDTSYLPNASGPKFVCEPIPAGYYYPSNPASDLYALNNNPLSGSTNSILTNMAFSGSNAGATQYGSTNSSCQGPFVVKNCEAGTYSSPDGFQCLEEKIKTDIKMPSTSACPTGTVENQGHCWNVQDSTVLSNYSGGGCTYSTRTDGVWDPITGLYTITCTDLRNKADNSVACSAASLQAGTCALGANTSINRYSFQRLVCPTGYEKENTNYGTLCYQSCRSGYTRRGAYCHSGVSSHARSIIPTKISTIKTEQTYNKNMELKDVNIPYCDFSDPAMLDRMANFYYTQSMAHPTLNYDGTVTIQIITRFFGVVASSELSCDVACEIQFITYNPYTGGDFNIKLGCDLPDDPYFKSVPHPFCYRRFYFIRAPSDSQGMFTVTGCTHQDYTSPDSMVCSTQYYSNPLVSLPKQKNITNLEATIFDPDNLRRSFLDGKLMTEIGIAQLSNTINFAVGFGAGAVTAGAAGVIAGRMVAAAAGRATAGAAGRATAQVTSEALQKATTRLMSTWTYGGIDALIQLGVGTAASIGTEKLTEYLQKLAGVYGQSFNVSNVVNMDITGSVTGGFKVFFRDDWWILDMGPIYELAPGYKPNINWCANAHISPDYCAHKYIVRDFVNTYHAQNGGYHIKKINSIEARGTSGCYYKFQQVPYNPLEDIEGTILEEKTMIEEHVISDYITCTFSATSPPNIFEFNDLETGDSQSDYPIRSGIDPVTRQAIYPFHMDKYTSLLYTRYVRIRSNNINTLNIANIAVYDISGINVALRKPVNVISSDPAFQPAKTVVDGTVSYNSDSIPSWKAASSSSTDYLEIDLGNTINISYLVYCAGDTEAVGTKIEFLYSNSVNETPTYTATIAAAMGVKDESGGSTTYNDRVFIMNLYNIYTETTGSTTKTGSKRLVSKYPLAGPIEIPRPLGSSTKTITLGEGLCSTTCKDASVMDTIITQYNASTFVKPDPSSQLIKILRGVTVTPTKCEYEGEFSSVLSTSGSGPPVITISKHFFTAEVVPPTVADSLKVRANKIRIRPRPGGGTLEVSKIAVYNTFKGSCINAGSGSGSGSRALCTFHNNVASKTPVNIYNFVETMNPALIRANLVAVDSEADLQPQIFPNLFISRVADDTAFIDIDLQWDDTSSGSGSGSASTPNANNITELYEIVFVGRGADRQAGNIIGTQIQAIVEDINGNDVNIVKTWTLSTDDTVQRISCLPPCEYTLTNFHILPGPNSLPLTSPPPINNTPYRDVFTTPDASGGVFSFKDTINKLKSVFNTVLPLKATDPLAPVVTNLKSANTNVRGILDQVAANMTIQNTRQKCSDPDVLREFMTAYNTANTPDDEFGVEQHTMARILKAGLSTPNTCDVLFEDYVQLYDDFLQNPTQTYKQIKAMRFEMTTVNDLNHDGVVRVASGPNAMYDISSNAVGIISDTTIISPVYTGPHCSINCMDTLLLARLKTELELLPQAKSAGMAVTSVFNTVTQSLQRSPNVCEYKMLKTNTYTDRTLRISTNLSGVETYVRAETQMNQNCSYMFTGVKEYPTDDITYKENKATGDISFYLNGKEVTPPSLFNYDTRNPSPKVVNTAYNFSSDPPSNFCAERWRKGTYCPDDTNAPVSCLQGYYCPDIGTVISPTYDMTGTTQNFVKNVTEDPVDGSWIYSGATNDYMLGGTGNMNTKCLPNKYCPHPDMEYLTDCPKGFYCPTGASAPKLTEPGYFAISQNQSAQTSCPSGQYCPRAGTVTPLACPPGKFYKKLGVTGPGATECTTCPAGSFCNDTGTSTNGPIGTIDPTPCPAGQYQDLTGQNVCKTCPIGSFCPTTGLTTPTTCPVGSFCPTTGLSVPTPCTPGGYCPTTGGSMATPCPVGTYCPNQGSTVPTPCPVGGFCPSVGGSSYNQCPIGGICPIPGGSTSTTCPPGQYCPNVGLGSMGSTCPPGTYSAGGAGSTCTLCPAGTYSTTSGNTSVSSCLPCPCGKFCPPGTSSPDSTCPAGYYCPPGINSGCGSGSGSRGSGSSGSPAATMLPCPAGTTSSPGSSTLAQCTPCPAGTYCPTSGTSPPIQCPAGTSSSATGQTSSTACAACAIGNYQDQRGQATCKPCQAGNKCPTTGMTAQTPCTPGTYQGSSGQSTCPDCPPGSFSATSGASACTQCVAGQYCPGGGSAQIPCPPGTYCPTASGSTARQCPIATYCPISGLTAGSPCPPGAYCPTIGQITPTGTCPPGTYSTGSAGSGCTPCPAGSACPTTTAGPQSCPAGKFAPASSTSCTDCNTGQYSLGGTSSCTNCPAGSYCLTTTSLPTPCPITTYNPSANQSSLTACQVCPPGQYCLPVSATVGCANPTSACPAAGTTISRTISTVIPYTSFINVYQTSYSDHITGIVFDSLNNMYIADYALRIIRKFTYQAPNWVEQKTLIDSVSQPFAGTINGNTTDPPRTGMDNGSAGTGSFYTPCGMVIDTNNIIYVTDLNLHLLRRIDTDGNVTTIVGGGQSTILNHPHGITIDSQNNLYVADTDNSRVLKVSTISPYNTTIIDSLTMYYAITCDGTNVYAATRTSIVKLAPPSSGTTWVKTNITYASTQATYISAILWRTDRLLVADNNAIYKVSPTIPKTLILGNTVAGSSDGSITTSTSNFTSLPSSKLSGLTFDNNNNLYINDYRIEPLNTAIYNPRIRMIRPYIECA